MGQRFGCNMISAIANKGQLNFMLFKKRFRAEVFLEFLRRLLRQSTLKTFLIIDGHSVNPAIKIRSWIEKKADDIRLFFLSGYSPDLNPDKVLNHDVKSNAVGRRRPRDQQELVKNVRGFLRSRQRQPHIVQNYFQEKHVR